MQLQLQARQDHHRLRPLLVGFAQVTAAQDCFFTHARLTHNVTPPQAGCARHARLATGWRGNSGPTRRRRPSIPRLAPTRSEENPFEPKSLLRISYAVLGWTKKK